MCATGWDTGRAPPIAWAPAPFPCPMAATSLLHLPLPLPDLLPQMGRISLSLAFQDVLSSPIDLRGGVEKALPPGLMVNCATARWIGHRWAFSGYIPELMPLSWRIPSSSIYLLLPAEILVLTQKQQGRRKRSPSPRSHRDLPPSRSGSERQAVGSG